MNQGLQVWDSSGKLILDTNYRIAKIIGRFTTGVTNGSRVVPDLANGTPIFFGTFDDSVQINPYWQHKPAITVSGTTISWTFPSSGAAYRASLVVTYGYF